MTQKQIATLNEIREALEGAVTTDGYRFVGVDAAMNQECRFVSVSIRFEKTWRFRFTGDHVVPASALVFIMEDGRAEFIDASLDGCPVVRIIRRNGRLSLRRALRASLIDLAA